jgi:hypothetical protein
MAKRTIRETESLEGIWEELTYTEARLMKDALAKDLAPTFATLIERWEKVDRGQLQVWRAEVQAQAEVDAVNDELDELTRELGATLLKVCRGERTSPRFVRYFRENVHAVVRMGLATQAEAMATWPESLASEPEPELTAMGAKLGDVLKGASNALRGRETAAARRSDQRVREVLGFVDDVNAARTSVYGALLQRAAKDGRSPAWAERFFRKEARSPAAPVLPDPA